MKRETNESGTRKVCDVIGREVATLVNETKADDDIRLCTFVRENM
jgi:hypothetical protein